MSSYLDSFADELADKYELEHEDPMDREALEAISDKFSEEVDRFSRQQVDEKWKWEGEPMHIGQITRTELEERAFDLKQDKEFDVWKRNLADEMCEAVKHYKDEHRKKG